MLLEFKIAKKLFYNFNNSEKKRFSFLTIASIISIMVGVMSILLAKGFINGFENELNKKVIAFSSHIEINTNNNYSQINLDSLSKELENNFSEIEKTEVVYNNKGIISKDENFEGTILTSFEEENFNKRFKNYLFELIDENSNLDYPKLIIGNKLKENINAKIGDTVIYSTIIEDNPYVFTGILVGSLETGIKELDENFLFIEKNKIEEIFVGDLQNKTIKIWCDDVQNIKKVANEINKKYLNINANTVYDLHKNIFAWIELQKIPTPIIMFILFLVAIVNVISLLLTSIIEKRYLIGVLRTLGMNNYQTELVFLIKGLIIITIGIILAILGTYSVIYLQENYHIIKMPIEIYLINEAKIDLSLIEMFKIIFIIYLVSILILIIPIKSSKNITPLSILK